MTTTARVHHVLGRRPAGRGGRRATRTMPTVRTATGVETVSTLMVGTGRARATSCSSTPARPSRGGRRDRLPLPVHRGRRARRGAAARRPRPLGRQQGGTSAALRAHDAGRARRRARGRRRRHGRAVRRRRAAVRVRQRRQLHRRRRRRRALQPTALRASRCRPVRWWPTTRCSPRSPTTSGTSSCSPGSSSRPPVPRDIALGLSTSGSSVNLLRAFAEARRIGLLTVGLAGYDGGSMAAAGTVDHCLVVRSDSVHRIQETQSAVVFDLWERVQRLLARTGCRCPLRVREAAVLERIEAFRRRRPRLDRRDRHAGPRRRRQVVGRADRRGVPRGVHERRARAPGRRRHARPARRRPPRVQHRLVRRAAPVLPRRIDRPPRGARHGQRRGDAGRAPALALRGVRASRRGSRSTELRDIVADMAEAAAAAGVTIVAGDTKVVDRGAADGLYITTAGMGVIPAGRDARRPSSCGPATSCSSRARSPTTAWR